MNTVYHKIKNIYSLDGEDEKALSLAGKTIRDGGLVAFPTETVYGLGANAYRADSALSVFAAKGRPSDNPLIVHVSSPEEAEEFAKVSDVYYELAEKFMPGPITVILPKKDVVPSEVTGGLDSVAVRCPSHPVAAALIKAACVPIAAPSANVSGKPSPTTAEHVREDLFGKIDMIIDGGACGVGLESTVVKPEDDGSIRVLRPGGVTAEMLRAAGYSVVVDKAVINPDAVGDSPASPGMKYKHYAPRAEAHLVDTSLSGMSFADAVRLLEADKDGSCAVICFDDEVSSFDEKVYVLSAGRRENPDEHARRLFALLRKSDEFSVKRVYCHLPSTTGLELALYNRAIRACAGRIIKL